MIITEFDNYQRQMDIIRPSDILPVTIIGCGALGSALGILCTKMGAQNIILFDGDEVEQHNIPNQYFGHEYLGLNKAVALSNEMMRYAPEDMPPIIEVHDMMFESGCDVWTPIVMLALDSLEARRKVIQLLKEQEDVKWVIDTRMAGEFYEIQTVLINDEEEYEKYLDGINPEVEVIEVPCTARSVIYTVATASSHAVNIFKNICNEKWEQVPTIMYENLADYNFLRTTGLRKIEGNSDD